MIEKEPGFYSVFDVGDVSVRNFFPEVVKVRTVFVDERKAVESGNGGL